MRSLKAMLTRMQNQINTWELKHGVVHHAARARYHRACAARLAGGGQCKDEYNVLRSSLSGGGKGTIYDISGMVSIQQQLYPGTISGFLKCVDVKGKTYAIEFINTYTTNNVTIVAAKSGSIYVYSKVNNEALQLDATVEIHRP